MEDLNTDHFGIDTKRCYLHHSATHNNMAYNTAIESFRDDEYPMMRGKVYLDHGGTTLYARSLIEDFSANMISNLYGNPHSESDPAKLSSQVVDSTREAALAFFGADPEHFDLIFTANATAAIKLVGESFHDLALTGSSAESFFYGYHRDAHTSIVGIRELTNNTHHCFTSDQEVEDWLQGDTRRADMSSIDGGLGLFAYPGQSNMTGRRLPLSWARRLRESSKQCHQNTYSLLDAAALATTTQLDFSDPDAAPDFTALSFYKIFGFPDLGALIVRKKSGHILSWRRYFGGGTINMLTVLHGPSFQRKDTSLHDGLEDGTLPFHNIMALGCAIKVHERLYGSMKRISLHTNYLARRLFSGMTNLYHANGRPVCVVHNEFDGHVPYGDVVTQGATIAFSVLQDDGTHVGHSVVERLANDVGIYVRSGGLCNPGGLSTYLNVEVWQHKRAWSAGHRCGHGARDFIDRKPTGVVRASLGAMTTLSDVDTFLEFLAVTFEKKAGPAKVIEAPANGQRTEDDVSFPSDSGFHSSRGSSRHSPVFPLPIRKATSVTNLTHPLHPKAKQLNSQQSYSGSIGKHELERRLQTMPDISIGAFEKFKNIEERRPCTAKERDNFLAGDIYYDMEPMPRGSFSHMNRQANTDGNITKRGKFKFWRGRKQAGEGVVFVS